MILLDMALAPEQPVAVGRRRAAAALLRDRMVLGMALAATAAGLGIPAVLGAALDAREAELASGRRAHLAASARMTEVRARVSVLEAEQARLAGTLGTLATLEADRYAWPRLMDDAARALPRFAFLDGVEMEPRVPGQPGQFRVRGVAPSQAEVSRFERALVGGGIVAHAALESSGSLEAGPFALVRFVVAGSLDAPVDSAAQPRAAAAGYHGGVAASPPLASTP